MKSSPSAGELEIALHQLLSKGRFTGAGHISVSDDGRTPPRAYHVVLSTDAAEVLAKVLSGIRRDWRPSEPTRWELSASEAGAVIVAAEPKAAYWPLSRALVRSAVQRLPF